MTTAALVCVYTLDGHGSGRELDAIPSQLAQPTWVHLQSDAPETEELLRQLGLPSLAIDLMTATETRPRMWRMPEGILVTLRGVNMRADAEPEDMVSLRFWITENMIVTARKSYRTLLAIQDVRQALASGIGPATIGDLVLFVIERLADRIGVVVDDIEDGLEQIETHIEDIRSLEARAQLTLIRRRCAQLKRYLAPQREALDVLYRDNSLLSRSQAAELREQTDRTTRYVEDLELSRERAILLQEELRNQIAEQQNARMYVLSLVTAIFLPLSFLTGVFGMNVMGLPGVENPRGFMLVAGAMVILALGLALWMRLRRWL